MQRTVVGERYTLIELLSSGGVAEVYLAHDEVLDRDVGIKVLRSRYASDYEFVERFGGEARDAARLSHPNIVSIYDQGHSKDGSYYVVTEYAPQGTLEDRIRRDGALEPGIAAGVALQISDALSAAHKQGVIHGDVKPRNVLVTRVGALKGTGDVKVTDFGIAQAASSSPVAAPVTVLASAGYASPEQARGEPVGPASDLYSLGVVLYEMLTGKLPYDTSDDPVAPMAMHANEPPRSPKAANPGVPELLDRITLKLLAKNPQDRYARAAVLSDDLELARSSGPPSVLPSVESARTTARVPERRRGGTLLPVAAVSLLFALVLLLGGSAWALFPDVSDGGVRPFAQIAAEASDRKGQYPPTEVKKLDEELRGERPVPGVSLEGSHDTDMLQGTDEGDALGGLSGDDELSGYAGDDRIGGDSGNDTLYGGSGSDVLLGGDGDDILDDGDDGVEDVIRCGSGFDTVTAGAEDDVYYCEDVTIR